MQPVSAAAFAGVSLALFATPAELSRQWAPVARAAGARVVDYSSAYRMDPEVPLVVPEVNGELLDTGPELVANGNCVAIPLVMTLQPLVGLARLERVVVASYQSVSGAGLEALEELERGVRGGLDGPPPPRSEGRPPFAFNVLAQIDRFDAEGWTGEERKIVNETRRMLARPGLCVLPTAVRVPVRVGHSAAVVAWFDTPVDVAAARAAWQGFPGVSVVDVEEPPVRRVWALMRPAGVRPPAADAMLELLDGEAKRISG